METIKENQDKKSHKHGVLSESALFSVVKPNPWTADVVVSTAMDGLTGRSASLKTPIGRKPSSRVREWVKRSNTSGTMAATKSTASEPPKPKIRHLGGGRLDVVRAQGPANNTTLLAPAPKRTLRSRASSIESRATQWLDFYTESPEGSRKASTPPPMPNLSRSPETPPNSGHRRAESHSDLRPAPLRVPSSEGRPSPDELPTPPKPKPSPAAAEPAASKPLTRQNSKWKPLPTLPGPAQHQDHPPRLKLDTVTEAISVEFGFENPASAAAAASSPTHRGGRSPPLEQKFNGVVIPTIRFDSPPPTPDSSAGGAAKVHLEKRGMDGPTQKSDGEPDASFSSSHAVPVAGSLPADARPMGSAPCPGSGSGSSPGPGRQITRQERIWLHVNYRGEAPFLRAWGLDIAKPTDRAEGLAILRELIQAEEGRTNKRSRGSRETLNGGRGLNLI
ncbi:uncharacterized protein C8A04DRAFT_15768 [Dichotomopilus funicola]|uniref:Uncharacterized protein n=1 Tax=Dichotomopilus funicola TaxID=1934379 RepID=A0AAN6UUV5_9PEZI|nr:hypothetical protein C8A04DRAFT_15768 [Dichotomopilus funicola]